jgi:hypothetical protein
MKYTIIETDPITVIMRENGDGTVTTFAADEANSDYQAYLNPVEHLTEIPTN